MTINYIQTFTVMLLLGMCSLAWAEEEVEADVGSVYSIRITGPLVNLEAECGDPCAIDEVEVVGDVGMKAQMTESEASHAERETEFDSDCYGECKKKRTQLRVSGPRTLKEGVEVSIEDRWAHIIIYSVTETEKGPATRRQHYEFRVDRPLIEVELDEHRLKLRAAVDLDPTVIRRKTINR